MISSKQEQANYNFLKLSRRKRGSKESVPQARRRNYIVQVYWEQIRGKRKEYIPALRNNSNNDRSPSLEEQHALGKIFYSHFMWRLTFRSWANTAMKTNGDSSKHVYGWFVESETQAETAYIDIFVSSAIFNDIRNGSELSLDNPSFVQASFLLRSSLVHELGHAVHFLGMLAHDNYEDARVLSLSGKTSSKSEIRDSWN
jgi:hypothetical protein